MPKLPNKTAWKWIAVFIATLYVDEVLVCDGITKYIKCGSVNNLRRTCMIEDASVIISVSVTRRYSSSPCHIKSGGFYWGSYRQTFGFIANILWVNEGCSAQFAICYRAKITTSQMISSTASSTVRPTFQKSNILTRTITTSYSQSGNEEETIVKVISTECNGLTHLFTQKLYDPRRFTSLELLKTTVKSKENPNSVSLFAILIPVAVVTVGCSIGVIFINKKRFSRKPKLCAAKVNHDVSFEKGINDQGNRNFTSGGDSANDESNHTCSQTEYTNINARVECEQKHQNKKLEAQYARQREETTDNNYMYTCPTDEHNDKSAIEVTEGIYTNMHPQSNAKSIKDQKETNDGKEDSCYDGCHEYFILEPNSDPGATGTMNIQSTADDEYNTLHKHSKQTVRDPNYDRLMFQWKTDPDIADDYSHTCISNESQRKARELAVDYSHVEIIK